MPQRVLWLLALLTFSQTVTSRKLGPRASSASGTLVTLYDGSNASNNRSAKSFQVVPTPVTQSPATNTPGCVDLPTGFVPRSGVFDWSSKSGTYPCNYFVFFLLKSCYPSPDGGESAVKAASKPTTILDFVSSKYQANAPKAQSVGCSYEKDPCLAFPCSDPNAICTSSSLSVVDGNSSFNQYLGRNCDVCKGKLVKVNGVCADPCAEVKCPAPGNCVVRGSPLTGVCWCPDDYLWNSTTKKCDDVANERWLAALNAERGKVQSPRLSWNATLAANASAWVKQVGAQCGSGTVKLTRIPKISSYNLSENDAYVRDSPAQEGAIALWMDSERHATRIVSPKSVQVGCGKAACYSGAFFVCLFWPFTV